MDDSFLPGKGAMLHFSKPTCKAKTMQPYNATMASCVAFDSAGTWAQPPYF